MKVTQISDSDMITVGADILPQSTASRGGHYAVCVYDGTNRRIIQNYDKVNLQKLIGIVRSSQATYLASDNIYELVKSPSQIPHLCLQLLPNTKLVQVTGSPVHGFTSLPRLMKQNGLDVSGKLSPLAAAEACAILSSRKLGYILEPFEDETKIIVSRSRSKGPGGWSQKRYGRSMDTAVNQEAKKIESVLIEHRFDFDKNTSRSKFGAQRVVFSVYTPIAEISKLIKRKRGELCQVKIFPVNRERVEFIPLSQQVKQKASLRRLIVGIDPGLTVGLSIMDLNGKVLKINSIREASRGQVIREITQYGKPSLVCVDVYPYPAYVEKIASTLNARLYTPRSVMTVSEKNGIARKLAMQHGVVIRNAHQRDALASAHKGYNKFKGEFDNIERRFRDDYDKAFRDEIKDYIIKGKSITEAIADVNQSIADEKPVIKKKVITSTEKPISPDADQLQKRIDDIKEVLDWERGKNTELYTELKNLEEKAETLQLRLDEGRTEYSEQIQREKAYIIKENQISYLQEKVEQLESEIDRSADRIDELKRVAWLRGGKGWFPLKVIRKFTQEEIERTADNYTLGPGDIVLILDTTGGGGQTAEKLLSYRIKAIIGNIDQFSYNAKKQLIESQIPLVNSQEVEIIRIDEIAVIKEIAMKKLIEEAEIEIDTIVTEKKETFLDSLVDEYRKEREKETAEYDDDVTRGSKKSLPSQETDDEIEE
ncbi:MAG: DUF460 domain-containing protein [Candidatus Heimdallarchaeaceae archaeon]